LIVDIGTYFVLSHKMEGIVTELLAIRLNITQIGDTCDSVGLDNTNLHNHVLSRPSDWPSA
jgi:hypothetical protein